MRYIYQHKNWPNFRWDSAEIASDLEAASFAIGNFLGRLTSIGFSVQNEAVCEMLSTEILNSAEIERAQRGNLDVTRWIKWFLGYCYRAVLAAEGRLKAILSKAEFWNVHALDELTVNQRTMLNMLFDGFKGNLTSSKWAKICKVSQDTASREINALVDKSILSREGQGRSTHYVLV